MSGGTNFPQYLFLLAVRILLALALIAGLVSAGSRIYHRLPDDISTQATAFDRSGAPTLRVVVRNRVANSTLRSPVELYHFDLEAARREFEASPRLAKQFDDFLARRMYNLTPVKVEVNSNGLAVAMLSAGDWWLHASASLDSGERLEWRLPVVVADRDQAIELSFENAYERTKEF
jgi:CRP-like cAMP-binding protein